jgi:F0F1-type ATP synthase alpha subunit
MKYLDNNKVSLLDGIREKRELNDDLKGQLKTALDEFKRQFKSA